MVTELHPLFPLPTLGTWKARQARASARKLARKLAQLPDMQWLALGQGKPVPQPLQAMQEAVARAERQLPPTFPRRQGNGSWPASSMA